MRSGDPISLPLRRRSADRRPDTAARRSAAAVVGSPATLPPFRSSDAVPTVVPVSRHIDLPLPLRALCRPYRPSAQAARCRASSRCRSASICRWHCARSGDPTTVPLRHCVADYRPGPRRVSADRRPDTAARRSAAAAARAPANLPSLRSGSASPTVVPVPRRVDLPLPLHALRRRYRAGTGDRCRGRTGPGTGPGDAARAVRSPPQ